MDYIELAPIFWRSKISKCSHSHNMMIKQASGACFPNISVAVLVVLRREKENAVSSEACAACAVWFSSAPTGWNGARSSDAAKHGGRLGSFSCDAYAMLEMV